MFLIGVVALPLILLALFGLAVRRDFKIDTEMERAGLAERGIATPLEARGLVLSIGGVIEGVAVTVKRKRRGQMPTLEVRASRDLHSLLPNVSPPKSVAGYRDDAEPTGPPPALSDKESKEAARKTPEELAGSEVMISRDGNAVRICVGSSVGSLQLLDRMVDAALALVDRQELATTDRRDSGKDAPPSSLLCC